MMREVLTIIFGAVGAVLLYYGAGFLVRGGVALAEKCHVPKLVIGLTLVAFGTSAPELVVSIDAALQNAGDISAGNVVGSNICNIALILGVSALITPLPVPNSLFRIDMPFLTFATFLFGSMAYFEHGLSRPAGAVLLAIFVLYLTIRLVFAPGEFAAAATGEKKSEQPGVVRALLLTLGGLAGLLIGAKLFVNGAVVLARLAGISEAVIALTIVALGTSLPELATSAVAAWKNEADIAVGNVVGSNLFNILLIMSVSPLVRPLKASGIVTTDLGVMCALVVLLWILMLGKRIGRIGGAVLLVIYAGYIALLALR